LEQRLALARSRSEPTASAVKVDLQSVMRRVIEELIPPAEAKDLDLGVNRDEPATVKACELDIMTLIRNLVDNAVRYTPDGGRIDVRVYSERGFTIIKVEDSGPGIPEEERP
jgi:two-component system, OmpR family, sensor kinase